MVLFYNIVMAVFATLSFQFAISYFVREKNIGKMKWLIFLLGLASGFTNAGYMLMSVTRISSYSLLFRNIGMIAESTYVYLEFLLCVDQVEIRRFMKRLLRFFGTFIFGIITFIRALPQEVHFETIKGYTAFVTNYSLGHYLQSVFFGSFISVMLLLGTIWFFQQKTYREKVFVGLVYISNFLFMISAVPYFLGITTSHPAFWYCLGTMGAYFILWYAGIKFSGFTVTEQSISSDIFRTVNVGLLIFSPDGKLNMINDFAKEMLGVQKVLEQEIQDFFQVPTSEFTDLKHILQSQSSVECKWQGFYDNKSFHVNVTAKKDKKNDPICLIFAITDITKEEEMIAEVVKANRVKSEFLTNISHEIRTPLNTILGMDKMILRQGKDNEILGYANDIDKAGQALLSMIDDILDFSKIESGQMEIHEDVYSLASLVNDGMNMVYLKAKSKNIRTEVTLNREIPSEYVGDEFRIRQILTNLLSNAVKYTPEGGKVKVEVNALPMEDNRVNLLFRVEDTGVGIKAEDMDTIFVSFERIGAIKNRNVEGVGLGLAITKQLVDMMHGDIEINSVYQEGSVFTVTIPQTIYNHTPLGEYTYWNGTSPVADSSKFFTAPAAKVLVVDDIAMNLTVFAGLLKSTKMDIATCKSGAEAIELVRQEAFDLIFMDHMMPVMDGVECMQIIRRSADHKNANTPIIVLTANAIVGAREEYIKVGFTDYVTKPVREGDLLEIIRKYLNPTLIESEVTEEIRKSEKTEEKKDSFLDCLVRIPDLDVELGLSYCMEDTAFYREMINSYVEETKYEKMEELYQAAKWDDYRIIVHALKSTSLSIGSQKLSDEAKALEFAARDNDLDFIRKNHERVRERYAALLLQLRKALNGDNNDQSVQTSERVMDITDATILVVDDDLMNIKLAKHMLESSYKVVEADSGKKCLEILGKTEIDLILLDIHMPEMDGHEVLQAIRENKAYDSIPVVFLTADDDTEAEARGIEEGALDYIKKPFDHTVALKRIERVLELSYLQKYLQKEVTRQTETAENRRVHAENLFSQFIQTMSNSIDAKDKYTNGHSARVAKYSVMLAKRMGYEDNLVNVEYIGLLHDIGKIGIPDDIINKPSKLTDEEYAIVKTHPMIGYNILKNVTEFQDLSIGARWHHERYDGKGYPDQLKGEEIPEIARIVGVADAYDAMTSKRSYRGILPQETIISEIERCSGTQFDPKIAKIMLELIREDTEYTMHE